jgi:hypothetical protein
MQSDRLQSLPFKHKPKKEAGTPFNEVGTKMSISHKEQKSDLKVCDNDILTLQRGHLNITAAGPPAVVICNCPFKFCSKLYYAS